LDIKLRTRGFVSLLNGNYVLRIAEIWADLYRCENVSKNFNKGSRKTPVYGKNPGEKISEIFTVRNFREIIIPVKQRRNDTDGGPC